MNAKHSHPTLVRFDDDHFGYIVDEVITRDRAQEMRLLFNEWWPGKQIIVLRAGSFIDLTGQYEILPIPELVLP